MANWFKKLLEIIRKILGAYSSTVTTTTATVTIPNTIPYGILKGYG